MEPSSGPQVLRIIDKDADNKQSYLALGAVAVDMTDPFHYNFDKVGEDIVLESTMPLIKSWNKNTGYVEYYWEEPAFYTEGSTALEEVVTGYTVYYQEFQLDQQNCEYDADNNGTPEWVELPGVSWPVTEPPTANSPFTHTFDSVPEESCIHLGLLVHLDSNFHTNMNSGRYVMVSDCLPGPELAGGFESVSVEYLGKKRFQIDWVTSKEFNVSSFNVLRSTSPTGPFDRVNSFFIPPKGQGNNGATYSPGFMDYIKSPKGTFIYYYQIEMVGGFGANNAYSEVVMGMMSKKNP